MTHIVFEHTRGGQWGSMPPVRLQVTESALPPKPETLDACCPHCRQALHSVRRHAIQRLGSAVCQLLGAVPIIVLSSLRLARLAIAMVLSLIGVVGFGVHRAARRIAHPDDRSLLPHVGHGKDPFRAIPGTIPGAIPDVG